MRAKMNENKRLHQVSFRVTEAEYERLLGFAEHAKLRPTEMARMIVNNRIQEINAASTQYDPAVIKRLDHIGQILRDIRTVNPDRLSPELASEIDDTVNTIHALVETAVLERVKE